MIRKLTAIGWEQGKLSQSGNKLYAGTSETEIRSISYIKTSNVSFAISALTSIFKKLQFQIWYFDEDKKYIVNSYSGWQNSYTYLPKTNYPYMRITLRYSNSATIEVSQILNVYLFEQSNTEIQLPLYMETNILGGSRINESQNAYKKIYQYQYVSSQGTSIDYNYSINKKCPMVGILPLDVKIPIAWSSDLIEEGNNNNEDSPNKNFLVDTFGYTDINGGYEGLHFGCDNAVDEEGKPCYIIYLKNSNEENLVQYTGISAIGEYQFVSYSAEDKKRFQILPVCISARYDCTKEKWVCRFACLNYMSHINNAGKIVWRRINNTAITVFSSELLADPDNWKYYYSYEILQG